MTEETRAYQDFDWTEERIALMLKLVSEGHSCSMVAYALGGGLSRNAVIGKLRRMKEKGTVVIVRPPTRQRAEAAADSKPRRRRHPPTLAEPVGSVGPVALPPPPKRKRVRKPKVPLVPVPVVVAAPAAECMPRGILDLANDGCRWAIEENEKVIGRYIFCNAPQMANEPYCQAHTHRSWAADTRVR